MSISIIIPTLNAGTCIEALLSSLSSQDLRPLEIIVIDSSSDDNTAEIAKRMGAKTIIIPRRHFNHGKTRNQAAGEAQGGILVFMTQDALPVDNSLIRALTAPLKEKDVAAVYGRHIPKRNASPLEIFARHFNYPEAAATKSLADSGRYGIKTFFFSNVCSAVKKGAFTEAGMFPEDLPTNEDMVMAAKLMLKGHRVAYAPEAAVIHSHNYSLFRHFRRYYNIGSFLRHNRWILNYARAEGEGLRFVKGQIRFVLESHRYAWIPYIFLEAVAKYAGYRLGLMTG